MHLRTLGDLELQGSGYSRPKSLLLLAYLRLEGEQTRHFLSGVFFGQARDPLGSLRTTLRRLRQEAPGSLETDGDPLRAQVDCDAQQLLTHLDAGELDVGVQLYTGPFLAGLHLTDVGVQLEEWIFATREYLATRVRSALLSLAERAATRGEYVAGAKLAERACWLEGAPDPEPEQFMRLGTLLTAGQSPLLGRLRQQAHMFEIEFRLSITEARQAFQELSPARTSQKGPDLPLRGTSFVGREVECAEALRSLERPEVRLLTLVGPGGIGKTRLALEVAQAMQGTQPVAFVSLEAANALGPLPSVIADALQLKLAAGRPPFEALLDAVGERSALLILDSAEHLLVGVPYLSSLLRACPGLTLLVTSRERLGLEEEWALTLGGLSLPAAAAPFEVARESEAVHLFAQRAKRARLSFELMPDDLPFIRQIGELVGGSPLGLELAAAWVKLMPVAEIAEEIGQSLDFLEAPGADLPARHHSVRAVFEQTWSRLSPTEAQVFARLSVFRGGFTREAAGAVTGASLTTLAGLVDRSLIRLAEHGRYELHVLLQQFARERLAQQCDEEHRTLDAHSQFFLHLSHQFFQAIRQGQDPKQWLERLERDLENVRAALTCLLERGQASTALQGMNDLRNFWTRTGRTHEARRWFASGLEHTGIPALIRENALLYDGEMARTMHDYAAARSQLEASLALCEARNGTSPLTVLNLGLTHYGLGALEAARGCYERALGEFRALGHQPGVASALNNLGAIQMELGAFPDALATLEESLRVKRELGNDVESVLANLGALHRRLGRTSEARVHLNQALRGLLELGYYTLIPDTLEELGRLACDTGEMHRAAVFFGAVDTQRQSMNVTLTIQERHQLDQDLSAVRTALGETEFSSAWREGSMLTVEQAVEYAVNVWT